jgi:hypothetical protein
MISFVLGMAVALAVIGLCVYVMVTNHLPLRRRFVLTHGCPHCSRRFVSLRASLVHEVTEHVNGP